MRRTMIVLILTALGLLAAACQPASQPVPTVAQLPTVTPTPTASPTPPPTAIPFFTPTPAEVEPTGADAKETPSAAGAESSPAPATPTPESLVSADESGGGGVCSAVAIEEALTGVDVEALRDDLDAFMDDLRGALADLMLAGWTLAGEPDPLSGTAVTDALPLASLRFRRGGDQEAQILVSRAGGALRDFLAGCIGVEEYFRVGGMSAEATIAVEPIDLGDTGTLAVLVEPVDVEAGDTGLSELTTEIYSVMVGDTLIQFVNIPALDEAVGRTPVSQEDAFALLEALVALLERL